MGTLLNTLVPPIFKFFFFLFLNIENELIPLCCSESLRLPWVWVVSLVADAQLTRLDGLPGRAVPCTLLTVFMCLTWK